MKKFRLIVKGYDDEDIGSIDLMVSDWMGTKDVLYNIRKATDEFLSTESGKEAYKVNNQFDYASFDLHVPNEICKKYGIEKVSEPDYTAVVDNELLADPKEMEALLEQDGEER